MQKKWYWISSFIWNQPVIKVKFCTYFCLIRVYPRILERHSLCSDTSSVQDYRESSTPAVDEPSSSIEMLSSQTDKSTTTVTTAEQTSTTVDTASSSVMSIRIELSSLDPAEQGTLKTVEQTSTFSTMLPCEYFFHIFIFKGIKISHRSNYKLINALQYVRNHDTYSYTF